MKKNVLSKKCYDLWLNKKVLLFRDFIKIQNCSARTIRRHLKASEAITSYNENGKFYTLESIANFNSNGLWRYKNICFSKHGNLKQTIIHLVSSSIKGMSAEDIFTHLHFQSYSVLAKIAKGSCLHRKKIDGKYIYFTQDIKNQASQLIERQVNMNKITDSIGIRILVTLIKNPRIDLLELRDLLLLDNINISVELIKDFLEYHELLKKTQISKLF